MAGIKENQGIARFDTFGLRPLRQCSPDSAESRLFVSKQKYMVVLITKFLDRVSKILVQAFPDSSRVIHREVKLRKTALARVLVDPNYNGKLRPVVAMCFSDNRYRLWFRRRSAR